MDQTSNIGEPSPSTPPGQTHPPRAPHPPNFTQNVPGDPWSHGSTAHHPRHQQPIPDHQDLAEMSEEIPPGRPCRPWSPDPNMMAPYPGREGRAPHPAHHPDPSSSSSSSSRHKNDSYFHSRRHLNPVTAQYGHPFPTEERRTPPLPSNKPLTHRYMPLQDRNAGAVPHQGNAFSQVDVVLAPQDNIPDQVDDNPTVDHLPEQWYPPSGPPDWRHGYDPRHHNVRSPDLYRGDPYPYTHPYHHYHPLGPGMARTCRPTNDWPYRYDYDPRSYMRYDPQLWTRPGPDWNYGPDSRYSERGRHRPPPPKYRGGSFGHPAWVPRYPYAHDPPYETQVPDGPDAPNRWQQQLQFQLQQLQPQHQDHYTIASDSHPPPSSRYEDMELRRHQTENSYRREEHGSDTPPSPPFEASASKAKATIPFSATTASSAQKQNAVDTLEVPANQEPSVALRPRQDERYQGPSPLAPDQTSSANKNRPHARGPSELPQRSPIPISAPRDNLIQASPELHKRGWSAGSLSRKLKTDPRTEYSSTPPSERISGYKAMPSRDMYPEAPLPDPKLTPSMRHDREGMWIQSLDDQSPRSPTLSLESRGRTGSLPGYLVHPPGFQRDGIPPLRTTGSPSGIGSLKATVSFSPSNSTTLPAIPSLSSSSSLSPPLVKLGQEGYYRLKDLEQLFQIWKAEHEQRSSRPGRDDHHHHHFAGGQDDGENMENHGGSSSNNGTATPTGPSWREKAKWKWNAVLQEYGSDGKKRKTMNDHWAGQTEDVDEDIDEHGARGEEGNGREGGESREDGQVDEFGDGPMEEDEDSDEDDYETDPQGESRKRRTDSAGDTSESGLSPEAHEQQMSRDPRQYKMNHHPTGSSGPGTQPAGSSSGTPLDSTLGVMAPSKKRRFRVRESKNHECKICGKRFSRPSQLRTHSFTHSGEKPHQCHMCYKYFNVASNLKRHIRTHASSCRKSSRLGNTVFRGFALGYPTRTHNESTHTTESIANTNPRQEESNTDDNNRHGHPESSGAQGHATRVGRTERPAIKHPLVTDSPETSQSNGSSSRSGSSTSGVPVMPPPSAPSHDPGSSQASGRKGPGQGRKGRIDDGESVEVPDTEG